ncbi:hypothetical protein ABT275_45390 [Streptomyces sp. NPDC001185]|uniref:hypothetical protein n=1 Tax=Streptomyces sp. NPDC001185 TaxID=3154380 RepID=UPI00332116D0
MLEDTRLIWHVTRAAQHAKLTHRIAATASRTQRTVTGALPAGSALVMHSDGLRER